METVTSTESKTTAPAGRNPCILVVDDDPDVLNYVASTLRRHGYATYSADCASFAMAVWRRHPSEIQLLLTDVRMPDLSGPELADKLLLLNPGLQVVYMSGQGNPEHGSFGFLRKPFTSQELLKAVRERSDAAAA